MELSKNIFFNTDKLIKNSKIKISYTGKLFNEDTKEVFLHYGYGNTWENLNELKMTKTDLGFQAELTILGDNYLNLCFRDANNNWDNNNNNNYSFPIEELELSLVPQSINSFDNKRLKKAYLLGKKFKLSVYKIMHYFPKLISKNYNKKTNNI